MELFSEGAEVGGEECARGEGEFRGLGDEGLDWRGFMLQHTRRGAAELNYRMGFGFEFGDLLMSG